MSVEQTTTFTNNATIIGHQGWSDFFSQNAIYNKYANEYDNLIIFVINEKLKIFIENMFCHKINISVTIPQTHTVYDGINTCLNCITVGNKYVCPRTKEKCVYIDYSKYTGCTNIKLAGFDRYTVWRNFYDTRAVDLSFVHCFYVYHGLNPMLRLTDFNIFRNEIGERRIYGDYIESIDFKDYIVLHESDEDKIDTRKITNTRPIYRLNNVSGTLIDQLAIINSASEIHLIDSSYACLIYYLCLTDNTFLTNKKVYIHTYIRPERDIVMYKNPTPSQFIFL